MRVLQYASRAVAAVALLVLAGGCGDSTAPDAPFDPAGTSQDVEAIEQSFEAPAIESYAAASVHISAVVGGSLAAALQAAPTADVVRSRAGALRHAASLARSFAPGARPSLSAASIPAQYLGTTFVWDVETDTYVASDESGAPSNGVRFVLYAVNSVTFQPIEPLVEVGYADLTVTETETSYTARAVVVSGGVTYLDYTFAFSAGTSAHLSIAGYATNGTDRLNFDLETTVSGNEQDGFTAVLDYQLTVPTRGGFLLEIEATISGIFIYDNTATEDYTATVELVARGDHGTVRIQGTETIAGGSYNVSVNGDAFATITFNDTTLTIVGPDGGALSQEERDALERIWAMFAVGYIFFFGLANPVL